MNNSILTNSTPLDHKRFNITQPTQQNKTSNSKFGVFLFSLSFAMVAGSLIFSFTTFTNSPGSFSINSKASEKVASKLDLNDPKIQANYNKVFLNVPDNPDAVTATASAKGKTIILNTNSAYPYDEVTFSWETPLTHEPKSKIIAYYVYFGPKNTEIPYPLPKSETSIDPKYD
ncbi:MAG: hypothetical protein Q7R95_04940, partial [bacterium]|nr:hypothetical protein [bacterium]